MSANYKELRQADAVFGKDIPLGRQGEHLASAVRFDLKEWQQLYGSGAVQLLHQRSMDEQPYPCSVTVTTGSATKDYDGLPLFCDEYTVEVT